MRFPQVFNAVAIVAVNCGLVSAAVGVEQGVAPRFPSTAFGEQARRWFETFNSGDFEAMRRLHEGAGGESAAHREALRLYTVYLFTRGLTPVAIQQTGDTELTITGIEKLSENRVNFVLRGSRAFPYPITSFNARPSGSVPGDASTSRPSEREAIAEIDRLATRLSEADEFSGAVLVSKDGNVILKKAWGTADHATGEPNRADTKFNIASAGKMFTSVAVLQLVQAGKLSLDDTVGAILPDYENKDVREKVTVRHLLTHTSGLADMFNQEFEKRRMELRTVQDFVSLFETLPLEFEPGTRWRYSNAGYCLLGAIIEKASGQDYYQYLDEHIFHPSGMINTGAFETDRPVQNMAVGYTRQGADTPEELRARLANTDLHVVKGSPSGGSYSTVEDLAQFADALLDHSLLSEEYTRLAMTAQAETGRGDDAYGFGFDVQSIHGHPIVGHGGGFPGISASFSVYPDDGYVVAVLSNYDMVARTVADRLRDWIVAETP